MDKGLRKEFEEALGYYVGDVEKQLLPIYLDEDLMALALLILLRKAKS